MDNTYFKMKRIILKYEYIKMQCGYENAVKIRQASSMVKSDILTCKPH